MTNTLKHLSLLTRMENSGLKPRLMEIGRAHV